MRCNPVKNIPNCKVRPAECHYQSSTNNANKCHQASCGSHSSSDIPQHIWPPPVWSTVGIWWTSQPTLLACHDYITPTCLAFIIPPPSICLSRVVYFFQTASIQCCSRSLLKVHRQLNRPIRHAKIADDAAVGDAKICMLNLFKIMVRLASKCLGHQHTATTNYIWSHQQQQLHLKTEMHSPPLIILHVVPLPAAPISSSHQRVRAAAGPIETNCSKL
jgi:hypothetical protein